MRNKFMGNKKTLLEKLILGMLVRKYKRYFPINKNCYECNNNIEGIIHRAEKNGGTEFIIYKSNGENKGISSYSFEPISTCLKINSRYYCDNCITSQNQMIACPICLEELGDHICTCNTCSKRFCFDCVDRYTATRLISFDDAPCPMCGKEPSYSVTSLRHPSIVGEYQEPTIVKESQRGNIFMLLFLCCIVP